MNLLRKYSIVVIGVVLGGVAGFLYWKFIGCASGTCVITSKPINSTIYGSLMGGLLGNVFSVKK